MYSVKDPENRELDVLKCGQLRRAVGADGPFGIGGICCALSVLPAERTFTGSGAPRWETAVGPVGAAASLCSLSLWGIEPETTCSAVGSVGSQKPIFSWLHSSIAVLLSCEGFVVSRGTSNAAADNGELGNPTGAAWIPAVALKGFGWFARGTCSCGMR